MQQEILSTVRRKLSEAGINQKKLAEMMDRPLSSVNRLLNGQKALTIEELGELCRIFGISIGRIIQETEHSLPQIKYLEANEEKTILETDLVFDLWNILKVKRSLGDILNFFPTPKHSEVICHLNHFVKKGVVIKDPYENYIVNFERSQNVFFRHSDAYTKRKVSVFDRIFTQKPDLSQMPTTLKQNWVDSYSDGFMIDYFTKDQIKQRKVLIRQLWNFMRAQRNMNDTSRIPQNVNEDLELRVFSIVDMAYPREKLQ
ncbi:MAG: helix-turn-helix transcriptional regulator [Bacteriovoracaceae bacterium]|jgi:transcriptional regulator with XRE-family HTH domain|nr:helix-turn-helix transcriptional regulator [Bacteriovoracaceae bacterium]